MEEEPKERDNIKESISFEMLSCVYRMPLRFKACWYFLALAACWAEVTAKLCVPEKSSLAHMYR